METHESGSLYRGGRRPGLRRTPVPQPITPQPMTSQAGTTTPSPVPLAERRWLLPGSLGVLVVGLLAGAVLAAFGLPFGGGVQAAPAHPAATPLPGMASGPSPRPTGSVSAAPSALAGPSTSASPTPSQNLPPVGTLHAASSQCLDLEKKDTGGWAVTAGCNDSDQQRWRFTRNANDQYTVVNLEGAGCLDVENASRDDGARIVQWTCHDADNQRWLVRWEADRFTLVSVYSGLCAVVEGDGKLRQRACRPDPGQRWSAEG